MQSGLNGLAAPPVLSVETLWKLGRELAINPKWNTEGVPIVTARPLWNALAKT